LDSEASVANFTTLPEGDATAGLQRGLAPLNQQLAAIKHKSAMSVYQRNRQSAHLHKFIPGRKLFFLYLSLTVTLLWKWLTFWTNSNNRFRAAEVPQTV